MSMNNENFGFHQPSMGGIGALIQNF
jgi:hypothetical protein